MSILKIGLKLGIGQLITQTCSFLRSVIIARLISPEDFGIAATFAMTFYLLDMVSNVAADKLLVQAEDGHEPEFQKTAHLLHTWRGLTNAAIIFVIAGPMSHLFGAAGTRWAFQCLAIVPLLRGFAHIDLDRMQRDLRFSPAIIVDAGSNILGTLLALPLALWLRNYSVVLWVLVVQAASFAVGSHLAAERPYGWTWNSTYARRIFAFGWPLLVNGLLLYVIFQGDRFIIGASHRLFLNGGYTLADLGIYSVAFSLTWAPTMLIASVSASLFLPILSQVKSSLWQFERRYSACAQIVSLLAGMISIPFIVAGGWLVRLIYGHKYAAAAGVIGWLAAMQGLRIIRTAPTLAAMAVSDTRNAMVSNIARTSALAGVLLVAAAGYRLTWIAASGFAGELLALGVCIRRLQRMHAIPAKMCFKPAAVPVAGMAAAAIIVSGGIPSLSWAAAVLTSSGLMIAIFLSMMFVFPGLRRDFRALVFRSASSPRPLEE